MLKIKEANHKYEVIVKARTHYDVDKHFKAVGSRQLHAWAVLLREVMRIGKNRHERKRRVYG